MHKVISSSSETFDPLSVDQENPIHYIPQLTSIQNLNSAEKEITDSESLQLKLNDIYKETENINAIISRHLESISKYESEQQTAIYTLYNAILLRDLESIEKETLLQTIQSPVCFVGLKAPLELLSASITYQTQTSAPFERWLNTQVVNYMNTVVTKIVDDINEYVFFNAEDQQSAHQKEPVLKYLDEAYNLYQGQYPDDVYNSLTPLGKSYIKESIKRVNNQSTNGGVFSLKSWAKAIEEQLNSSESVPCCAAYIFELGKQGSSEILNNLTERLYEGEIDKDYLTLSENKYKPTPKLIELLLKHRLFVLEAKESDKEDEATTGNHQVSGSTFCLRNGIKEKFIRAAHGTDEDIKEALETKSHEWDVHEKVLFLHIVTSRFKGKVSFLNLLTADQRHMFSDPDLNGITPLSVAAEKGHDNVIKELLKGLTQAERLAYCNQADNNEKTPLYIAAQNGQDKAIEKILNGFLPKEQLACLNQADRNGFTPLFVAAGYGHVNAIQELLKRLSPKEQLACLNQADNSGRTPLHYAVQNGHERVIIELLKILTPQDQLAYLNKAVKNGATPLIIAAYYGQTNAIIELLKAIPQKERLTFLKKGVREGFTPLYVAAEKGHDNVIKELLKGLTQAERLGYCNQADNDEITPLRIAAEKGHDNVIKELLKGFLREEQLACLNQADRKGFTPLLVAAKNGHAKAIEELFKEIPQDDRLAVLKIARRGLTPLFYAAEKGHDNVIKELLKGLTQAERLAYLNQANKKRVTPLFVAAQNGHEKVINELLQRLTPEEQLAYLNQAKKNGLRPLSVAIKKNHENAITTLQAYGAKDSWYQKLLRNVWN